MTANLYGSESIEQYTFNRWAARVRKGLTYRSQSDAVIISYAGRKTPRFPVSEHCGKQDWWVTRSDVWVEFPSVRALLEVMRDKTMRQALAKSKKQAVESVKSSETLRFFDNALITMPFSQVIREHLCY